MLNICTLIINHLFELFYNNNIVLSSLSVLCENFQKHIIYVMNIENLYIIYTSCIMKMFF